MSNIAYLLIKYVMICGGLMVVGFLTDLIIKCLFGPDQEDPEDREDIDNMEDKG